MTGFLRRHWLLLILLAAGVTLRVLTWLAYQPALLYIDTFRYLSNLDQLRPTDLNPLGYTVVLKGLLGLGGFGFVAAVQHLVGLLIALAVYRLVLRYTTRTWLAALATAPLLLDAYQLQIEENIMSEVWFQALLMGALWALLAKGAPNWRRAALAGVLIAAAVLTRTIGITLVVPFALYLIMAGGAWRTRAGWKRIGIRGLAGLLGVVIPLVAYSGYFASQAGRWGLTGAQSNVLYGRTAAIADCSQLPSGDAGLLIFCPPEPMDDRLGIDYYTHFRYGNPDWPFVPLPDGRTKEQLANEFAWTVIGNQPFTFAGAILEDFAKNFSPLKITFPNDVPVERWQFQTVYPFHDIGAESVQVYNGTTLARDGVLPGVDLELASFLRNYQLHGGYTWGPLLAIASLAGLLGALGVGRARRSGLRSAAFLATGSGLILLLGSAAFEFSWRYQLPALLLLPLGGALGAAAMFGLAKRDPGSGGRRPNMADYPDEVDDGAVAGFSARYGDGRLTPIVVVIAAYNEAKGIGAVLRNMPTHCGDLPVSTLVVVDGATDNTAEIAAENGAYVCVAPSNRGQGGALRLGYHLAAQYGAEYIVTTDADGQYDNAEMPMLVKPLLDGTADFVTGSRRLGTGQYDSKVRWLGVRVFAVLATILTNRKITDTSFGFRAMKAELATSVTLREPQYQSSELLLGVMAQGARVLEVPMTMHLRNNGQSKKGRSLKYGANYARVMTGTWLREYVLRGGKRKQRAARAERLAAATNARETA
ncbi:glycosyltransferase family 2 protein [Prauserella cavernicola]|uniref:Glycosyltransferase family 2 protein n=1 Tax=Prauserella cavernicola TaxID=2800127 RepID=A0A934V2C9_9PSEU|nr:glycosyltransferase family 2 protein [Prauserella cavernicola]MBK1785411.1 glycosyltransferase family 2 protein [Prauserella cavernicola]